MLAFVILVFGILVIGVFVTLGQGDFILLLSFGGIFLIVFLISIYSLLSYQQSRNGKIYFIVLNLTDRKPIRVSGLIPSLPIVYLTLKNWLNKNAGYYPLFP